MGLRPYVRLLIVAVLVAWAAYHFYPQRQHIYHKILSFMDMTKKPIVSYKSTVRELAQGKDNRIVDHVLDDLKSPDPHIRRAAIENSGRYDDARIPRVLMNFVASGKRDIDYYRSLAALARLHYEPAWPYVVRMAQSSDFMTNNSIEMIRNFKKPEGIDLLVYMQEKLDSKMDSLSVAAKSQIEFAIESLKTSS